MRSTSPGKLSSSQDFSIGRSISLTRSSSVRALLLNTVLARLLKADSTAVSVNSRSSCGSTLRNAGCGASGTAISSVSSNTSTSGAAGLISASDVASSRPASIASMSSWLLDTGAAAAGGGATGGGAGLAGAGGAFAAAACAAGIADGGMLVITGALAAGATTAGFSSLAAVGLGALSAAAGFASSSSMMRRIDARISSIEGSWTFAGCVISDSTSSNALVCVYIKQGRITASGYAGRD